MSLSLYLDEARATTGLTGLETARADAMAALEDAQWPSMKSESYRYAPLSALKAGVFTKAAESSPIATAPLIPNAHQIIVSNGIVVPEGLSGLPTGLTAHNRAEGADAGADLEAGSDTLALLNTALATGGLVLTAAAGAEIDTPVELLHSMAGAAGKAAHVRHVITLEAGAKLTVIERSIGDDNPIWFNETLTLNLAEGAALTHIRVMEDGAAATHTARLSGTLAAHARYQGLTLNIGGAEARFEAALDITGNGAHAQSDAVILSGTGQSREVLTHVTHAVGGATSDQIIRSIAGGRGRASFQGKVTVAVDAQQTEADQSVKSLMLDRTAEVNAKPELEIYADDVKCSHGATVGELDEKALFYLTSRGIDPETAERILVDAFLEDALVNIQDADLRTLLGERIAETLTRVRSEDAAL